MMKKILSLIATLMLMQGMVFAQTQMAVPHGSFEQWTSHAGYNVSLMGMSLPVYDSYSTPTGWGYLAYPINESITALGSTITVNTTIPLIKASQETGLVPDSNNAVKLQTFMLSEIVTGLVYALAAPNLDPMLTSTVFPSILATGEVNLDSLIPIITTLLANTDSIGGMLTGLAATDVNNLITGGIALGSFEPSRLTGSYKYHSGDSADNGGVLLLGTHYNTTTHRREVVGGGVNIALTDVASYTPFTVEYQSLHELDASFAEQAPDSLVVLLVSSASENREQGSYLCLDNLWLWQDTTGVVPPPPDTCVGVTGLAAVPGVYNASLSWNTVAGAVGYELEYGTTGFTLGSGTMVYPTSNAAVLNGLAANTSYDVYVRANCSGTTYGDWGTVSFTTLPDSCADVEGLTAVPDIHEAVLSWNTTAVVSGYELEYGTTGFTQGSGTTMTVGNNTVTLTGLDANTAYDVYVRTVCNGTAYGNWVSASFTTQPDTCASVRWIEAVNVVFDAFPEYELQWWGSSQPDHWEVEYGPQGFELGSGTVVETNESSFAIYELEQQGVLQPNTWYDFYVRSVCEGGVYGEWDSVHYRTFCATVEDLTLVDDNISVNAVNFIEGYKVTWVDNSGSAQWLVSYGTTNSYNWHSETVNEPFIQLEPLRPNTRYEVEVSARCGEDNYGEYRYVGFTTINVGIAEADASSLTVSPNPANGRCVVSLDDAETAELKMYGADGRLLQTIMYKGVPIELQLPSQGVYLLQATTANGVSVRKIVNK